MNVCPAMVIVPVRSLASAFGAALYDTAPDPAPDAPLVTISQSAFDVAVHAHAGADALTTTLPLPPAAATVSPPGEIVKVHGGGGGGGGGGGAAWVTVNVWPAITIVPVRAAPVFASTLNPTVPLPAPEAPLVTSSHGAFDTAVQPHAAADATTETVPDVAVSPTFWAVGASEKVHGGGAGAAACVTVSVWPAIVIVPARAAAVFCAIVKPTVPLPVPAAPLVTVSQGAFDAAVHVHVVADAVTAVDPAPPMSATS